MKLWLLLPNTPEGERYDWGPWDPWYDKAFGFVIRAETEDEARRLAQDSGGDEVREHGPVWTDPTLVTCEELTPHGELGVILRDFYSA